MGLGAEGDEHALTREDDPPPSGLYNQGAANFIPSAAVPEMNPRMFINTYVKEFYFVFIMLWDCHTGFVGIKKRLSLRKQARIYFAKFNVDLIKKFQMKHPFCNERSRTLLYTATD